MFSFATPCTFLSSYILSTLLCQVITITTAGFPEEARLLSLNWGWEVKKLICCLISKLPSPVSGPDPVRAVVNFNHGWSWSWVITPELSIPEGQSVTAVTASSANPDWIVRSTICVYLCACVCVCVANWNQVYVLVASGQRHIDSIQRFTVHNDGITQQDLTYRWKLTVMIECPCHSTCVRKTEWQSKRWGDLQISRC